MSHGPPAGHRPCPNGSRSLVRQVIDDDPYGPWVLGPLVLPSGFPEGSHKNGRHICPGDGSTHLRQDLRKVLISDSTLVLLAQPVDDLDPLGPQLHPGARRADLLSDPVHEPAHDLIRNIQVPPVETDRRLPCRVLVGNDRGHQGPLIPDEDQPQVPGVVGHGVHRGDRDTFWCGLLLGGCGGRPTTKLYTDRVCHFAHHPGPDGLPHLCGRPARG